LCFFIIFYVFYTFQPKNPYVFVDCATRQRGVLSIFLTPYSLLPIIIESQSKVNRKSNVSHSYFWYKIEHGFSYLDKASLHPDTFCSFYPILAPNAEIWKIFTKKFAYIVEIL